MQVLRKYIGPCWRKQHIKFFLIWISILLNLTLFIYFLFLALYFLKAGYIWICLWFMSVSNSQVGGSWEPRGYGLFCTTNSPILHSEGSEANSLGVLSLSKFHSGLSLDGVLINTSLLISEFFCFLNYLLGLCSFSDFHLCLWLGGLLWRTHPDPLPSPLILCTFEGFIFLSGIEMFPLSFSAYTLDSWKHFPGPSPLPKSRGS